jgi:hypothetical protein
MNEIIHPNAGEIIAATPPEDSFGLVFSPARPTLEMVRTMRPALHWCDRNRTREGNITVHPLNTRKEFWAKNRAKARFMFDLIPDQDEVLDKAQGLFDAAEHEPAPVDWLQAAVNLMLAGFPNARGVSEHYAAGIVDAVMDDPEVWQGYEPGFSCPVIVRAIREVKRSSKFVPTHAELLELCQNHRRQFRQWQYDLLHLHNLRDAAEAILMNLGELQYGHDGDDPF